MSLLSDFKSLNSTVSNKMQHGFMYDNKNICQKFDKRMTYISDLTLNFLRFRANAATFCHPELISTILIISPKNAQIRVTVFQS